jgi:PAS domain S-box-containing protein
LRTVIDSKFDDPYSKTNLLLQHMVEGVKDYAIFLLDTKGYIASWNAGAERMKGYHEEEILGKHFSCFYTKEDLKIKKPDHALQVAVNEGRYEDIGWRVRKDGSRFWADVIISPVHDSDGIFQGFTKITRDLTEQKKSEEKFKGILESAPDSIVITNPEGKILMVNARTENLFGYNRDEMIGQEVEILIPDRFREGHYHHRKEYNSDPEIRAMGIGLELYGIRKDGKEFPVEVSLSPIHISDEELLIFAAVRDITVQKKAESEIKQLNKELDKRIAERTSELELSLRNEKKARLEASRNQQKIIFLSKASEILSSSLNYSHTLSELAKTITPAIADWCIFHEVKSDKTINPIIISHIDQRKIDIGYELARKFPSDPNVPKGLYKVIRTHKPEFFPAIPYKLLEVFTHNEEHLLIIRSLKIKSLISVPLIIREKVYGIMTLILEGDSRQFDEEDLEMALEIARRASLAIENGRLYQEAQDLNMDLEQRVANRTLELATINKELESFSYSVSHDLRAPLRSIDGFSNLILKKYVDLLDETGKDYFSRVIHASQQMGHLIDDLIKLSQITRIEMNREITDLSEMAGTIAAELKASQPGRKAAILIQPQLLANVDRNLMQIALHNLFDNSWKYSRNQPNTKIEFGTMLQNDKTVYYIRDNGVGFDMKYVDKLFGAFQRLHSTTEFEGTGIGLATVQRIIRRHSGKIWVEGELDKGATFYFTLQ